jgi:hypothetical protein
MKKKLKQSETIIIKRSQINFAPYNPKKHSKEAIQQQKDNFKKIGFLGGIVWNRITGNLVSGHKRVMAQDLYYGYDEIEKIDYDIKVEAIELTEKQEKEQNIYMDAKRTNTPQDYEMLAVILPDIELENTGLTDYDIQIIESIVPDFKLGDTDIILEDLTDLKKEYNEKKEHVKNVKKQMHSDNQDRQSFSYFTITFKDYNDKAQFLEQLGINGDDVFVQGEKFIEKIEEFYQ